MSQANPAPDICLHFFITLLVLYGTYNIEIKNIWTAASCYVRTEFRMFNMLQGMLRIKFCILFYMQSIAIKIITLIATDKIYAY